LARIGAGRTVVCPWFLAQLLARHWVVNQALAAELAGPILALALHTDSPTECAARADTPASPPCLEGGR